MKTLFKISASLLFVAALFFSLSEVSARVIKAPLPADNCNSPQNCVTGYNTQTNSDGDIACCTLWSGNTTGHKELLN